MIEFNFNPFPIITTERLLLRRVVKEDLNAFFIIRSDAETMKYIPRPIAKTTDDISPLMLSIDDLIDSNEGINWAISLKTDNKLIGTIGFYRAEKENHRAEIGYILNKKYHRKGIMQEAIVPVISYGFEKMKLHTISAVIDPENIASAALLEKNGFVKEAHFKEDCLFEGKFLDSVHFSRISYLK